MTTINELRQRIETKYLEPVIEETPAAPLAVEMSAVATTFTITADVLSPDEESYLGAGRTLEIDNELIKCLDYDYTTKVGTCLRGVRDTTAAVHLVGAELRFPTRWPRQTVVNSIHAAIGSLWSPLAVSLRIDDTVETAQYVELPASTVRVVSVEYFDEDMEPYPVASRLIPKHPLNGAKAAVQIGPLPWQSAMCAITYAVQIIVPADDDTTIANLPTKWERIIIADVGADLLSGVDIDAVTQENLTESMRLDRFPVKSGYSISQNLIRYREYLVDQAASEIKARDPIRIRQLKTSLWSN